MTDRPQADPPAESRPLLRLLAAIQPARFPEGLDRRLAGGRRLDGRLDVPMVHAAGSGTIKVGLVGCGGRGTGAAEQALTADSGTGWSPWPTRSRIGSRSSLAELKGLGDRPPGRRPQGPPVHGLRRLQARDRPGRPGPPDHAPALPADPPGLRGREGRQRVRREADGRRRARACGSSSRPCKDAKAKNLSLVNGFCWRY